MGIYPNLCFFYTTWFFNQKNHLLKLQSQPGYCRQTGAQFSITALGLAGTELTFPTAALIVLCFVVEARTVLTAHQCFGCC